MLNKRLLVTSAAMLASASLMSTIANAANVTANASATVLTALSITQNTAMNFGDVAGDADAATTVVLTTAGATSSADGASAAGTPSAGIFDVVGAGTLSYSITLPADGVVTLTGPSTAMPVDGFNHDAGGAPALAGGADQFNVGATLTINANQAAGAYSGTYNVVVNYN